MNMKKYNFNRCKLCGEMAAEPSYALTDSVIYSCQNCDFHFLNQLDCMSEKLRNKTRLNEKSRQYIESRINESAQLHPKRIELVCNHVDPSGSKALDIGAGLGQFQLLLNSQGAEVQGIEPSNVRREYAREKFGINLHRELVDSNYWQTGFTQYFDLITLWDVIEHVDFPHETLETAINLLKPGGFLFLDTPSREVLSYKLSQRLYRFSSGKMSLFLPSFYSTAPYGHKQIFTWQQLTGLLENLGLEVIFTTHSYTTNLLRGNKIILGCQKTAGLRKDYLEPESVSAR